MMIHTNEKPFSCCHCDRSFTWKGNLERHKTIHANEKRFTCSHCDRSFSLKSYLERHKMIHNNEKPFSCSHCDRSFTWKCNLERHKAIHANEKLFSCYHFERSFALKRYLKQHMMIHANEKSFTCSHCDRSFARKTSLERHKMIHSNEKPFLCSHCDWSSTWKSALERHKMVHTTDEPFAYSDLVRSFNQRGSLKKHMIHKNGKSNLSLTKKTAARKLVQVHAECKEASATSSTYKSFNGDDSDKKEKMNIHSSSSLSRNQSFFKEESLENYVVVFKQSESATSSRCSQSTSCEESGPQLEVIPCIDNSLVCSLCHQTFVENEAFENHVITHALDELPPSASSPESHLVRGKDLQVQLGHCGQLFVCPYCDQSFLQKEALEKCLLIHEIGQSLFDTWVLIKNYCDNSSDLSPLEEKTCDIGTQIIPSNEQSFSCSKCKQFFPEKEALEKHKFVHHFAEECESLLNISYSSQYFNSLNDGRTSVADIQPSLVRRNTKLFTCSCCNQSFSYEGALNEHVMGHKNQEIRSGLPSCQLFVSETELTEHEINDLQKGMPFDHQENTNSCIRSENNYVYQESNTSSVLQESPNLDLSSQTRDGIPHGLTNTVSEENATPHPSFDNICNPNPENISHVHRENTDSVSSHNIENNTAEKIFSCFLCEQPFFEKDESQFHSVVRDDERHHTCPSCTHLFAELSIIRDDSISAVASSFHEESSNLDFHSEIGDYIQ